MEAVKMPEPASAPSPRKPGRKPRGHKIGGAIAAIANKAGIGKPLKKFPPQALVTDAEYERARRALKRALKKAKTRRQTAASDSEAKAAARATRGPRGREQPAQEATPRGPTTYGRGDFALIEATRVEDGAWRLLCEMLRERGIITDEDLGRSVEDVSTPGTRALTAIRSWAEALVALEVIARETK